MCKWSLQLWQQCILEDQKVGRNTTMWQVVPGASQTWEIGARPSTITPRYLFFSFYGEKGRGVLLFTHQVIISTSPVVVEGNNCGKTAQSRLIGLRMNLSCNS